MPIPLKELIKFVENQFLFQSKTRNGLSLPEKIQNHNKGRVCLPTS